MFLFTKPHIKRYMRQPRFFKNCREEEEEVISLCFDHHAMKAYWGVEL
jgi:hypothetical protein